MFITFEGIDGCGKSTQAEMLADYLREIYGENAVLMTREPGGNVISEQIRGIILNKDNTSMSDMTETMLYAASRAQIVAEVIKPALEEGKIVICDRFVDSSVAYQGAARGVAVETVELINSFAVSPLKTPDITFLLDILPRTAVERRQARQDSIKATDRLEAEGSAFFEKVRSGYLNLAERFPERIVVIDALETIANIHSQIKEIINLRR